MPTLRRARPNRRMLRLLVLVVVLAAIALGVRQLARDGGSPVSSGSEGGTVETVGEGAEVTVSVGDVVMDGDLSLVVTSLTPMTVPTGPRYPMTEGVVALDLSAGESYYQVFARVENKGAGVVRFDPEDFSLDADGVLVGPDPSLTGPGARSLLHGASLNFILTFIGPEGLAPRLVYRTGTGGTVTIEGMVSPAGVAGTPS